MHVGSSNWVKLVFTKLEDMDLEEKKLCFKEIRGYSSESMSKSDQDIFRVHVCVSNFQRIFHKGGR